MAQHKSAKTRIRRNARAADINGSRVNRIRSYVKAVEVAITAGDQKAAKEALKKVMPELMRGANRGVIHKKTVSRKISRLSSRIKGLAA